jgi:predicted DNA-binding transcriptional regulator AlpA
MEADLLIQTPTNETSATTVEEFCHAHRISRATFYNLLKAGQGPSIMKIGSRTLVSNEAAAAWRQRMERPVAAAV